MVIETKAFGETGNVIQPGKKEIYMEG